MPKLQKGHDTEIAQIMFFYYYLDVLYQYLHVFSNYKTLESPYDVTINEHVLHTTLPVRYTFAGTAIAGQYQYTVWTYVRTMHVEYTHTHAIRPVA